MISLLASAAERTVTWLDYVTFGVYIAATLAVGLSVGGKQKDLKMYLLAGHQMHWAMIAISVLAALFSGISFLGAPAESFNHNLVYLWVILAYFVATPITTLVFLPFFYRLNFYTAYEYLEHRFDLTLRRLSSAAFVLRVCFWLALALSAPSLVISEMTGIPLWESIVFTGACTTLYTAVGGMRAVIYTDVMQFCVLLTGIVLIFVVAVHQTPGGLEAAWRIAQEGGRTTMMDWSLSPTARLTVWGAFFGGAALNLVQLVTDQISVQRYLTATSLKESQRALWFKLFLTVPLISIFYLTGLVLYSFYQTHPEMAATLLRPDQLLAHFVGRQIASPVPGLLVAAILAATMSAASSGINSLTTATLIDFLYTMNKEAGSVAGEAGRVRTARRWTVFYGCVATGLALVVSKLGTLIEASSKIAGFFGGPLLGIFFLGVLSRRANAWGALIGAIVGFGVIVGTAFGSGVSFIWYALIGAVVTYAVGEVASRFFAPPNETQRSFTMSGRPKLAKVID
ncbi:hypothetical protein BH09VER1_BH09VER1_35980 [soil metagenome]